MPAAGSSVLEVLELYDGGAMLAWSDDASRDAALWCVAEVARRALGIEQVESIALRGLIGWPIDVPDADAFARQAPQLIQYDYRAYEFNLFVNGNQVGSAAPLDQSLRGVRFRIDGVRNVSDVLRDALLEVESRRGVAVERGAWYGEKPPDPRVQTPLFPVMTLTVAAAAGWLLNRIWPLPIANVPQLNAAGGVAALAALLVTWSIATLWRAGTTVDPNGETTALVTKGPFRFSRNPIYIAQAMMLVAAALFFNTWWIVATLLPWLVVINSVAAREEAYLRASFGAPFEEYEKRVRRWL